MNVAIVGLSPSTRHLIPWGWEVWGLPWDNELCCRFDRHFEMHDRGLLERPEALRSDGYWERLSELPKVYMQRQWDDILGSVEFPLGDVQKTVFRGFPRSQWNAGYQGDWYNSSPAYMLALAIHEGAQKIGLYGIDVRDDSEFAYESPCLEYLIGLAVGRGIEIVIPEGPTALGMFRGEGIKLGTMTPTYHDRYGYV
jgi:hypothetical protein